MSIIVNNILIPTNGDFVNYNGVNVKKVVANDVVVWEREDKVILPDRYYIWDGQTLDDGINDTYNNYSIINGNNQIKASCSSFINGNNTRSYSTSGFYIYDDFKQIMSQYNKIYFSAIVGSIGDNKNFSYKTSLSINGVIKASVIKSAYNLKVGDEFTYYLDISGISESVYEEGNAQVLFSINNSFSYNDKKSYNIGVYCDEISLIDLKDAM